MCVDSVAGGEGVAVVPSSAGTAPPPDDLVDAADDPACSLPSQERRTGQLPQKLAGVTLALVITVVVYALRDHLKDVAQYGYVGLFLIGVLGNATIVLPMPTLVSAFIGGGVFNPILVGVISAAGATIGELTGYLAGMSGKAVIENREMYDRFDGWMRKYGLIALFLLAAFPNPFFDVAGIIAGMSRMRVTTYLIVVWAGKIVKFVVVAYLGASSLELLERLGLG